MEYIIGFILGVMASFVTWYILSHHVIPKIEFFPNIYKEKNDENPSGFRYLIRFKNLGSRDIIDLDIMAKLRIHGIYDFKKWAWKAIYIPIDDNKIPKINSHKKSPKRTAVQLCVFNISDEAKMSLPDELQEQCNMKTILLEDLFKLGDKAELKLFLFGYDTFSGTRKLFESKVYTSKDIIVE